MCPNRKNSPYYIIIIIMLDTNLFQCYTARAFCDGSRDCVGGGDEDVCETSYVDTSIIHNPSPPVLISFDGLGRYFVKPLSNTQPNSRTILCPETHFRCDELCLPVFVRCNGVFDCLLHEDEAACDSYTCPGFYRCRGSRVCVHPDHVCDGVLHCPQRDDELLCKFTCPGECRCYGWAFDCRTFFPVHSYPQIRYLSARDSGLTAHHLANNTMLIHLSLAKCQLVSMADFDFPNLHSLDLSDNAIRAVHSSQLNHLPRLRTLFLSNNPMTSIFEPHNTASTISKLTTETAARASSQFSTAFQRNEISHSSGFASLFTSVPSSDANPERSFQKLLRLDISFVKMSELRVNMFRQFPNLQDLNLSGTGVERVVGDDVDLLAELRVLDMRGCPMLVLPHRLFRGLGRLHTLYADNYKLCCPAVLPKAFNPKNCLAPSDEISSCETLLRSDAYRAFLSIVAVLTLAGNLGSFIFRFVGSRGEKSGFHIFALHLCVADFLMGVYLSEIGVADRLYLGTYLWEDRAWRHSAACKAAGFFSLLSSEASVFIICLITLDRFLVLRFPFSSLRFQGRSAHVTCAVTWSLSALLAAVPLFPWAPYSQFYSSTGICIPLPITRRRFDGSEYAFSIMIVLNFMLFLLIALGQVVIYKAVRANSMATSVTSRQSQDSDIARRLFTVAMTDFLCWFPIGLLGLMASQGTPIPGEVNVGMAIFVLPLNSVINPFLYTMNIVLERRRKQKEERLLKLLDSD